MNNYLNIGLESYYKNVKQVQFSISSPSEIEADSCCKIEDSRLKIERKNNTIRNNIYDSRMGVTINNEKCDTCGCNALQCPGHFGHIELKEKILNPKLIKYALLVLKCVCYKCSRSLLSDIQCHTLGVLNLYGEARSHKYKKLVEKIKQCQYCHTDVPNYSIKNEYIKKKTSDGYLKLTDNDIYNIFIKIKNEEYKLFGFNNYLNNSSRYKHNILDARITHKHESRPEWMIFTFLPVLPSIARPPSYRDGSQHEDDLTDKYITVIKTNNKLNEDLMKQKNRKKIKSKNNLVKEVRENISTLFDNKSKKSKIGGTKVHTGIRERIDGKDQGIIRSNIQGKRTNDTGRTVVGPSGYDVDTVCIPQEMAEILTKPMCVNYVNIHEMQKLVFTNKVNNIVRNGHKIILYDPKVKKRYAINSKYHDIIKYNEEEYFKLKYNDIVERQIQNGDYVLVNRQPTLRLESMMSFKIQISDEKLMRLSMAVTTPYNFDCDGPRIRGYQQAAAF